MATPRPMQYQRRKGLVKLVISTPLLLHFPQDTDTVSDEEQQPRLPFHRRSPLKHNVVDNFKACTIEIGTPPKPKAIEMPLSSANRPTRSGRVRQTYYGQAPTNRDLEKMIAIAEMAPEEGIQDVFMTPPRRQPTRKSRKRVISDNEDEYEDIKASKETESAKRQKIIKDLSTANTFGFLSSPRTPREVRLTPVARFHPRKRVEKDEEDVGEDIVVMQRRAHQRPFAADLKASAPSIARSSSWLTEPLRSPSRNPGHCRSVPALPTPSRIPPSDLPMRSYYDPTREEKASDEARLPAHVEYILEIPCSEQLRSLRAQVDQTTTPLESQTSRSFAIRIPSISGMSGSDLLKQVRNLVRQYNASLLLEDAAMEEAILKELQSSSAITFEVFSELIKICRENKDGGVIQPASRLGVWLVQRREEYIKLLSSSMDIMPVKQE